MARKKRKYTRRKPLRQDTLPLSSLFMGLLPILIMAGVVGIYIIYQYTDLFSDTGSLSFPAISLPSANISLPTFQQPVIHIPSIHFPEITVPQFTFSFGEIWDSLGKFGTGALNAAMTTSEFIVSTASEAGSGGVHAIQNGTIVIVTFILQFLAFLDQGLHNTGHAIGAYSQTVGWTIGDFFTYLDLPGKGQAVLNFIFWPLHFLNPVPAVIATSNKVGEINHKVATTFAPLGPVFAYVWKSFQETAASLWQSLTDAINFLNWVATKSN